VEKERMQNAEAKSIRGIGTQRIEGRGENNAKRRHSLMVQYFAAKFKLKIVYAFLLHTALTKCTYLLLVPFGVLYSEGRAYKREPEPAASPQSTTLHSTGNTSVKKRSQPQQHTWNSKALLFFRLKYCCT
jgi:hypothetical protein